MLTTPQPGTPANAPGWKLEAERLALLCAARAEEAHGWATQAWRNRDLPEAQACSMQEISWHRNRLAWEHIALHGPVNELPTEPVPTAEPVKHVKKREYKPRPKAGGHWPPICSIGSTGRW